MATISSAGIGSGLDVNSIITQLMAIEQQPLKTLQTKATTIQSTVSEYGKIKSTISTLRDLASKLASTTTWGQTTSKSSGTAVAASSNGSAAGTYSVEVQKLASVQTLATGVKPATTAPGGGTLHIELGTWGVGQTTFTPKTGATAVDVTIAATDTLADVRDKINAAGSGVTAMVMTDSSGSRLLLRSNASGAENAFRTSVVDDDGVNNDATGLSMLAFDPSSSPTTMTQSQIAADAAATVNGLPVTSTSNTLANIVDGLTLTLNAETTLTGPVTVNVLTDTETLKKTLTDFAAAYTAVVKLIGTDTKYDPVAKKGGILQGDSAAVGMQRQLRLLAGSASAASATFGHLSDAGLELQADGSMTVNATKVDAALANVAEMKKLFSSSSATDPTLDGFGKRFRVIADSMIGIDGALTTRTDGLGQQLNRNQKDQDALQLRLDAIEKRYRAQYTALDTAMAQLTSQSGYITQQIAAWNANSGQ
ncbi:MAG: flagellar filament capping protein FliD [Burkholderiales bacterium]|nr:flagellar filament capping protein FliD [Burkholderiales bacterium]